jgi:GNAT superfamily N-acetyltransferase
VDGQARPASPEEAEAISALALRSKAHWGYPPEQMEVFRRELVLPPEEVVRRRAHVTEQAGQIVGFYTLVGRTNDFVELEHLFIDPSHLGRGLGTKLFRHACALAQELGFHRLIIQSDPHAAGFYEAMGAHPEGEIPSSIPGRHIPLFTVELGEASPLERPRKAGPSDR